MLSPEKKRSPLSDQAKHLEQQYLLANRDLKKYISTYNVIFQQEYSQVNMHYIFPYIHTNVYYIFTYVYYIFTNM